MASIRVINDNGEVETQKVLSRGASVIPADREVFDPAVVQSVEYDHRGGSTSVTSVCGETENRRTSDKEPDITIEGVITDDQIPAAKGLKKGEEVTLVSDIHQGEVYVKRLTISQSTDIIHYIPDGEKNEQLAFTFQLQLGQPGDST